MNKKKVKFDNYTVEIIRYTVIIILIIINIYVLSSIFKGTQNTTFMVPASPQINTTELKSLENIVSPKLIYGNNSVVPVVNVPNIFH
ncbi:hypothetical protein M1145_02510 [Patescibacteria group bacterium]|nr:hypothetical protein [Patescibacteria group bacterium]